MYTCFKIMLISDKYMYISMQFTPYGAKPMVCLHAILTMRLQYSYTPKCKSQVHIVVHVAIKYFDFSDSILYS